MSPEQLHVFPAVTPLLLVQDQPVKIDDMVTVGELDR